MYAGVQPRRSGGAGNRWRRTGQGLRLERRRVPLGVIGVIYEAART